jgi:hypothetical protein
MQKMQMQKAKVIAAKAPAMAQTELEVPASPAASQLSTTISGQIRGEECMTVDYGSPPRLSLVHALSNLAEEIQVGEWGLSNGLGAPVALGPQVEMVPLTAALWWLQDFGQGEVGGLPTRFATVEEVVAYGGTTTGEPGKLSFSRSMELKVLLKDTDKADSTFLRVPVSGRTYLCAVYEAARSAYRVVGVGFNLSWANSKEAPHQRRWRLGVATRKNKQLGANYYVPTLANIGPVSAEEAAELVKLIDRQLLE